MDYDGNVGTRTLITVEEFERLPDDDNRRELDEGELIVTPPPGWVHGIVQGAVAEALRQAARNTLSGMVVTECAFRGFGRRPGPERRFYTQGAAD
jgi:Uma2 family endonuclease